MSSYVKFMRGTPEAFERLTNKESDVLYFISSPDSNESQLYLGSKLITSDGTSDVVSDISLSTLTDVSLDDPIMQDSLLVYDVTTEKWVTKNIEDLILDMPEIEVNAAQVFEVTLQENESHEDAIARVVGTTAVTNGDIVIIKSLINEDKYEHIAYIRSEISWLALSDKYNANNIYFDDNLSTITTTGQNLKQVLEAILTSIPEINLNNSTLAVINEQINLKNYGLQYYKYIAASGTEGEDSYIAAHYELQIVDEEHPWIAGLEPKVALEDEQLVLAWYEPVPVSVDTLQTQVITVVNDLKTVETVVEELVADVASLETSVVSLQTNVYTKEATDLLVQEAIAASNHLTYKIVDFYEDIDPAAPNADLYIYLVPRASVGTYEEYMVINGSIEKVGDWNTDLSDYATKVELQTALVTKVDVVEGSRLMTEIEGNKLATIEEGAQKNLFDSVSNQFEIDANRQLKIISVEASQVTDLESLLNAKADKVAVDTVTVNLTNLESRVINVENALNSYVTIDTYNADIAELRNCLTWQELE